MMNLHHRLTRSSAEPGSHVSSIFVVVVVVHPDNDDIDFLLRLYFFLDHWPPLIVVPSDADDLVDVDDP